MDQLQHLRHPCLSKTMCRASFTCEFAGSHKGSSEVQRMGAGREISQPGHVGKWEARHNIWSIWLLVLNSQLLSLFYHCLPLISLKASLPCNLKQRPHACDSKHTRPGNTHFTSTTIFICVSWFLNGNSNKYWESKRNLLQHRKAFLRFLTRCSEVFCHPQWCQTLVEACSKLQTNNTPCHARLMCY